MPGYQPQVVFTRIIFFQVAAQANRNQPFGLDIVAVSDKKLLGKLQKLSATEWFAQREQHKLDFPTKIDTWEWEIVPGQHLPYFKLPKHALDAVGLLVFVQYTSEGDYRARLDPYEAVVIQLQKQKLKIKPVQPG